MAQWTELEQVPVGQCNEMEMQKFSTSGEGGGDEEGESESIKCKALEV